MTRVGNWKVAILIACIATVGTVHAADSATATDTQSQLAKEKSKDKVTKASMSADKDKGAKAANGKTETASKASTTTALDPGLEVPSARNRPATAATPGTRGFPKKTSESPDKSTTDTSNANGAKKPATGN